MGNIPLFIKQHNLVTEHFGYWPSFHDGEIVWMSFDRTHDLIPDLPNPQIEFRIHTWELTSEITPTGHYRLTKHCLVHFVCAEVFHNTLIGFNHQNAVLSIEFNQLPEESPGRAPIRVMIDPAFGVGGEFTSYDVLVKNIKICNENGKEV